jgi:hypothetical protein
MNLRRQELLWQVIVGNAFLWDVWTREVSLLAMAGDDDCCDRDGCRRDMRPVFPTRCLSYKGGGGGH